MDTFACPECGVKLRRTAHLRTGVRVQCPNCQLQFPVPEGGPDDPLPAPRDHLDAGYGESPVARAGVPPRTEGKRDEPASTGTRRADDLPASAPGGFDLEPPQRRDEDEDYPDTGRREGNLSGAYRIDLNRWFSHAREHWPTILGPAIGFLILYGMIYYFGRGVATFGGFAAVEATDIDFLFPVIHLVVPALLEVLMLAPLLAGLTVVALAQLKGERWSFGTFFSGFRRYGAIITLAFIQQLMFLPAQAGLLLVQLGGPMGLGPGPGFLFGGMADDLLLFSAYLGGLAVYGLLWVRLFFFALPLIIDRGYGAVEAMAGSWRLSRGHFLGLLGMAIVLGLINIGGAMLCGVGLLFSVPFTSLVFAAGYLLAGGTRPPVSLVYDEDYGYRRQFHDYDEAPRWRDRRDEDA